MVMVWIGFIACLLFGAANSVAAISLTSFNMAFGWEKEGTIFAGFCTFLAFIGFYLAYAYAPFGIVFK